MVYRKELSYMIIGGIIGWGAIYSYNAIYNPGGSIYVSISLIGSVVSGFLAAKDSLNAPQTGVGAAIIGTLPILYIMYGISIQMADGLITDKAPWVFLVMGVIAVAILLFHAVAGSICGKAGSWIANEIIS
jgi:hypothetical protein